MLYSILAVAQITPKIMMPLDLGSPATIQYWKHHAQAPSVNGDLCFEGVFLFVLVVLLNILLKMKLRGDL